MEVRAVAGVAQQRQRAAVGAEQRAEPRGGRLEESVEDARLGGCVRGGAGDARRSARRTVDRLVRPCKLVRRVEHERRQPVGGASLGSSSAPSMMRARLAEEMRAMRLS